MVVFYGCVVQVWRVLLFVVKNWEVLNNGRPAADLQVRIEYSVFVNPEVFLREPLEGAMIVDTAQEFSAF